MDPTLVIVNEQHALSAVVATANYYRHGQYSKADVREAIRFIKRRCWELGVQPPAMGALKRAVADDFVDEQLEPEQEDLRP